MWWRLGTGTLLALLASVALVLPATAGGFAVTTFDQLPTGFRADETYRLGYTIRQHGVTPVPRLTTRIIAQQAVSGATEIFSGTAEGAPGHYVAEVRLPTDGVWVWRVEQGPFAPQQLGTLTVLPSADVAVREPASSALPAVLRVVLPAATLVALGLFAGRVLVMLKWTKPVAVRRWPAS